MIILKVLSLIVWLLVVPFCMGLLFLPLVPKGNRTMGTALIAGYTLLFTILELVGIPTTLLTVYNGMSTFSRIFAPCLVVCALVGIVLTYMKSKKGYELNFSWFSSGSESIWGQWKLEDKIVLVIFLLIVGFQLFMAFTRASFDGDDAYYGVQAVIAQQVDTLYRVNPYTGRSAPLDVRHALALFPIWEAYLGNVSGIHSTIVSHSIVPLVLIPLTYLLYWQIGKSLLEKKPGHLPMFMVLIALWQMFANISFYTSETFFLTRTWQGKSFMGNFIIPAIIWIFLELFRENETGKEKNKLGFWMLLACINLAGGASSSLAILLSCLMTAGFGALFAIWKRRFSILVKAGLSCIGGGAYVVLYVCLTHGWINL